MSASEPLARFVFGVDGEVPEALEFLKRTRNELRMLRLVRLWPDRFQVLDVNGDAFEIEGLGYRDPRVVAVLDNVNAAYKRDRIHDEFSGEYKEFKAGRRHAWAEDRVM